MPLQLPIESGDSLLSLAQKHLGDASKWREIADLNQLNPLENLPIGKILDIPTPAEVFRQAEPILDTIAQGLNGAQGTIAAAIVQVQKQSAAFTKLVPQAQALLGEVNGVLGQVESVANQANGKIEGLRKYSGEPLRLVDWLLN